MRNLKINIGIGIERMEFDQESSNRTRRGESHRRISIANEATTVVWQIIDKLHFSSTEILIKNNLLKKLAEKIESFREIGLKGCIKSRHSRTLLKILIKDKKMEEFAEEMENI